MSVSFEQVESFAEDRFRLVHERSLHIKEALRKAIAQEGRVTSIEPFQDRLGHITDFEQLTCCPLFMDIRNSTTQLSRHGPKVAYVVGHTFHATMGYIIENSATGKLVDYTGDGVYALFLPDDEHSIEKVVADAGLTAIRMMQAASYIVNPLIERCRDISDAGVVNGFAYGIGLSYGPVIITYIGSEYYRGIVAIGECVNRAHGFSNGRNRIVIAAEVYERYPKSQEGTVVIEQNVPGSYDIRWKPFKWE